ncbi:hypothetical protein STEG23_006048, partial [Scotinomys teguina]
VCEELCWNFDEECIKSVIACGYDEKQVLKHEFGRNIHRVLLKPKNIFKDVKEKSRDIYRLFHPNTKEYTFSAPHGTFSKTDHILIYKASLNRYENLIFDKDAKTVKWKKESIFNKWCWHNWMATCRRLQIDPYLSPCTKLKSKWIKDLNINPVTLNLIEEKVGSTLERIGTGDYFLNITPTAQTLSATINQWNYMKLRSFCKAKDTITKTKRQPTEWEKIFTNPTSDRGLISRIYKELKKHDIKTSNSPIEKWAIEVNREFTAEEYRMAERHLRKWSASLLIREMQIKTTLRYHFTPVRMAKIKKTPRIVHVGEDVKQEEHSSNVGGNADWYSHSGKQYGEFSENWESFFLQTQPYHSWAYTQRMPSHTIRTHAQLCS